MIASLSGPVFIPVALVGGDNGVEADWPLFI